MAQEPSHRCDCGRSWAGLAHKWPCALFWPLGGVFDRDNFLGSGGDMSARGRPALGFICLGNSLTTEPLGVDLRKDSPAPDSHGASSHALRVNGVFTGGLHIRR